MRTYLVILCLVLVLSSAFASQITKHDIRITMKEDGSAYIEEEYLLRLTSDERGVFKTIMNKESPSIDDWSVFGIKKSIISQTKEENVIPEMTQSDVAVVTLQYTTNKIVKEVEKRGKERLVGITESLFTFYDGKKISLPYDPPTTLVILVPNTLRVSGEITPPPFSTTQQIGSDGKLYTVYEWNYRRPFSSDKFRLLYSEELTIQSQLSPELLLKEFEEKYGNPVYIFAAVIILGILVWYRKQIIGIVTEAFSGEPVFEEEIEEEA
ncbi:MAG: hypothetical protein J7K68_02955 [Candidatus Diapherotrites archaeon]|nr:hypothetical protein [Candidatus Diapherotrites archaeon]